MEIIPSSFKGRNQEGDFKFMIESGNYEDSLFIFNDNEEEHFTHNKGGGNAVIRPYNRHGVIGKPHSAGISTGKRYGGGGYKMLDSSAQQFIDQCISEIVELCRMYGYRRIFFSADKNGRIGTSIFQVEPTVLEYITSEIHSIPQKINII